MHLIKEKNVVEVWCKKGKGWEFLFVERKSRRVMNDVKISLAKTFWKILFNKFDKKLQCQRLKETHIEKMIEWSWMIKNSCSFHFITKLFLY